MGRVVLGRVVFGASCPDSFYLASLLIHVQEIAVRLSNFTELSNSASYTLTV